MKTLPAIGQRVTAQWGDDPLKTCVGVVRKHYPKHDDEWDEATDKVIPGPLLPHDQWHVAVELEGAEPPWWPYTGHRSFAPMVSCVEPI